MDYFDPWKGANQGAQTLANLRTMIDSDREAAQKQKLMDIQTQTAQMGLAEALRKQQVEQGAMEALKNADAAAVTTFAPPQDTAATPGKGFSPGLSAADPSLTAATPAPKVNHDRVLLDHYRKYDPPRAAAMEKLMMDKFKALSEVDPSHAIDWYNEVSGLNLTYAGKKGDYSIIHTPDNTVIAVNTKDPKDVQMIQKGTPKDAGAKEQAANASGFQSAIAGLTGPSAMGTQYPVGNTGVKTGYAPLSEVEKDIRMAGADYGAKGEDVNKAVDDARSLYKETYVQGQRVKPKGGKNSYVPEYNLMGQQKDVGKSTDINLTVNTGSPAEAESWAKAIREGRANLSDVPARGAIKSQVVNLLEKGGGVDYAGNKAENNAYTSTVTQQTKQLGSMGSFVRNLNAQIDRVGELSTALHTFDSRLLNVPLRKVRGEIAGSPLQAKYDMYLTEIESEIGKLSTGSTASVAELSQSAQAKWAKIHDKNLSVKDMLEVLKETKHAGELRMQSVKDQLDETKQNRQNRGKPAPAATPRTWADYKKMKQGS